METPESENNKKAKATAPGAAGEADLQQANNTESGTDQARVNNEPETVPGWVQALLESNNAVIESNGALTLSNNAVVEAVNDFRNAAAGVAAEIVKTVTETAANANQSAALAETKTVATKPEVKFDRKADYVVAAGKRFLHGSEQKYYHGGDDVSHLSEEQLKSLLSQKIIVKA